VQNDAVSRNRFEQGVSRLGDVNYVDLCAHRHTQIASKTQPVNVSPLHGHVDIRVCICVSGRVRPKQQRKPNVGATPQRGTQLFDHAH
jgi:hypothetical protein